MFRFPRSSSPDRRRDASEQRPPVRERSVSLWRPTGRWHGVTLAAIYLFLLAAFVLADRLFVRLPDPYGPRDIPRELTPWLRK